MNNNSHITHHASRITHTAMASLRGERVVVKLGGEVLLNAVGLDSLAGDIALLSREGVGVVVVHGGGPQADALTERLGHQVRKVAGRRITDDDALEVAKMVYAGSTNVELLAALKKHGGRGVGVSGVDGSLISVTRRPVTLVKDSATGEEEWVDFGHVGDISSVDVSLVELLLQRGYVPVVASLAADSEGNLYNVNADTIAQALAIALGATRLVLVTNVPGILRDPGDPSTLVQVCTPREIEVLVAAGAISGGMLPKAQNCVSALEAGVASVQLLDGTQACPPLLDSLTGGGGGTLIVRDEQKANMAVGIW